MLFLAFFDKFVPTCSVSLTFMIYSCLLNITVFCEVSIEHDKHEGKIHQAVTDFIEAYQPIWVDRTGFNRLAERHGQWEEIRTFFNSNFLLWWFFYLMILKKNDNKYFRKWCVKKTFLYGTESADMDLVTPPLRSKSWKQGLWDPYRLTARCGFAYLV